MDENKTGRFVRDTKHYLKCVSCLAPGTKCLQFKLIELFAKLFCVVANVICDLLRDGLKFHLESCLLFSDEYDFSY